MGDLPVVMLIAAAATAGCVMNAMSEESVLESDTPYERDDTDDASQTITEIVMQLAKVDLRDRDRLAALLKTTWSREKFKTDQSLGWVTYHATAAPQEPWLDSAREDVYLEAGEQTPTVTAARLELRIAKEICFRARTLKTRFYSNELNPILSSEGGLEMALNIEGTEVVLDYRLNEACVNRITVFGSFFTDDLGAKLE